MTKGDNLTGKQEAFCACMAKGDKLQRECYRECYNKKNIKDNVIDVKASELMANGKIKVRIKDLNDKIDEKLTKEIAYERKDAYNDFGEIIEKLQETLKEVDLLEETKDKIYARNAVLKSIKENKELQAKLFSLFVQKTESDVNIKNHEDWLKDLKDLD